MILIVQVEVAAAGEVGKGVATPGVHHARGQRHRRQQLEGIRVEHHQPGPVHADTDRDDSPGSVEDDRRALRDQEGRATLHVRPERPRGRIGVGHIRVVVDVAAAVRRHERVRRDCRRSHLLRGGLPAEEGRRRRCLWSFRDRLRGLAGERPRSKPEREGKRDHRCQRNPS